MDFVRPVEAVVGGHRDGSSQCYSRQPPRSPCGGSPASLVSARLRLPGCCRVWSNWGSPAAMRCRPHRSSCSFVTMSSPSCSSPWPMHARWRFARSVRPFRRSHLSRYASLLSDRSRAERPTPTATSISRWFVQTTSTTMTRGEQSRSIHGADRSERSQGTTSRSSRQLPPRRPGSCAADPNSCGTSNATGSSCTGGRSTNSQADCVSIGHPQILGTG